MVVTDKDRPATGKPGWIRTRAPLGPEVNRIRQLLREHALHTVCEEASCPNLGECFSHGTATFMIMGDICTRRCPFCNVAFGKPGALDDEEPRNLARAISSMGLKYVVITSVDRDDIRDGGASHFVACINEVRDRVRDITIEILVPDFKNKLGIAVDILSQSPPDVFNHNLETVPRLYKRARPGADYNGSLSLLKRFKQMQPSVPTKSGLMLGLGESMDELKEVLYDLREHDCDMITLGQYLQPSRYHLPVERYIPPEEFGELGEFAREMGFMNVASSPLVRSSYHADLQASGKQVA